MLPTVVPEISENEVDESIGVYGALFFDICRIFGF